MGTPRTPAATRWRGLVYLGELDIYDSPGATEQEEYDLKDYRRSLYINTKDDHPCPWTTAAPCGCESGDDAWAESGAMSVHFPRARSEPDIEAG